VPAQHESAHVLDRDLELCREEMPEAGAVEHAGHADHLGRWQTRHLLHHAHHRIERIGDADVEGVGAALLDVLADRDHHLGVDADEVVAAHAGFARHTRGDDHHVRAVQGSVVGASGKDAVERLDWRCLGDVEGLALGYPVDDVEQADVAKFLHAGEQGECAPDLPRTDECDFVSRHGAFSSLSHDEKRRGVGGVMP
jgi:hypothetical protein